MYSFLREFRAIDCPDGLQNLLVAYCQLHGRKPKSEFMIFRRLLTQSWKKDSPAVVMQRVDRLKGIVSLGESHWRILKMWAATAPSTAEGYTYDRVLSVTRHRFENWLSAEADRLESLSPEIVRNTVSDGMRYTLIDAMINYSNAR